MPALFNNIPDDLMIGIDETPLQYSPNQRGSYVTGLDSAVWIAGESDRRQATATPCTTKSGELAVMQLIWRGKTTQCLPHMSEVTKDRTRRMGIFNDFAEKKCQTSRTWSTLLGKVAKFSLDRCD